MNAPLWLGNLVAYWLQVALLVIAGTALAAASRLRAPRVVYAYWQGLLAACLLLPLMQPWQPLATTPMGIYGRSRLGFDPGEAVVHFASFPLARLVTFILISGTLLRLAWLALGLAKLRSTLREAHRLEPLPRFISNMQRCLGVEATFCLADGIDSPATFGIRRPMILLPRRILDLGASQQEAIAAHELLHIRRQDWAFHLAEEIILAGLWFHPAVWWVVNRIRLSREQVVDREVIQVTGARKPYLSALLEMAVANGPSRGIVAPAFLNESQLAERIRMLVKEDVMSKRRVAVALAGVTTLTIIAGLMIVRAFPLRAAGVASGSSPDGQSTAVYGKKDKDVTRPVPIYKPEPRYTKEARDAKLEGTVAHWIVVAPDGSVSKIKLIKGLGKRGLGLDESVEETLKTWKFQPAMKAAKPVPYKLFVETSFKLF